MCFTLHTASCPKGVSDKRTSMYDLVINWVWQAYDRAISVSRTPFIMMMLKETINRLSSLTVPDDCRELRNVSLPCNRSLHNKTSNMCRVSIIAELVNRNGSRLVLMRQEVIAATKRTSLLKALTSIRHAHNQACMSSFLYGYLISIICSNHVGGRIVQRSSPLLR